MKNLSGLFEFPTILLVIGMVLLLAAVIVGIFAYKKPTKEKEYSDIEDKLDEDSLEDNLEKIKKITKSKKEEVEIIEDNTQDEEESKKEEVEIIEDNTQDEEATEKEQVETL